MKLKAVWRYDPRRWMGLVACLVAAIAVAMIATLNGEYPTAIMAVAGSLALLGWALERFQPYSLRLAGRADPRRLATAPESS